MQEKMRLYGYTCPDSASLKIRKASAQKYEVRKQSNLSELMGGANAKPARGAARGGNLPPSSALAANRLRQ